MRRGRLFFYLAFILILGLVAALVLWQRFLQPVASANPGVEAPTPVIEMSNVVVVAQRIPRGNVLDETVLSVVPVQRDLVLQGMFSNVTDVIGRQVKFDLDAGIPLTASMLVNTSEQLSSTGSNAALSIPRGMVAVSIPIDKLSSVSYAPKAGDHVNVIATMSFVDLDTDFQTILPNNTGSVIAPGPVAEGGPSSLTANVSSGGGLQGRTEVDPVLGQTLYIVPSEDQRPRSASQALLQDAVVLHMGDFPLTDEKPAEATPTPAAPVDQQPSAAEATPPLPAIPEVITLIVSPQDAVTLNYLVNTGAHLTLALRATGDDSRVQTEAVTLQFLLDQYRIPVPVKLPYGITNSSALSGSKPTPAP